MLYLHLGNIRLSIFPDVIFSLFTNLQILRISSNGPLSNVPSFTLIHPTLRHLEMQSIGRTENSPYPTFDYTTIFRQMTRMTLLYMYTNNLQQFPFPSAEYIETHFPALTRLHVADNMIQSIPDLTSLAATHSSLIVSMERYNGFFVYSFSALCFCQSNFRGCLLC